MAKRKKKGTTKRRSSRRKTPQKSKGRRRGKGRGGKRVVATPGVEVLYFAGAMVAGEVIADALLTKEDGDSILPDMVNDRALGLWAYGYWYRQPVVQQLAYALELVHLAEQGETDYIEELKEKVSEFRGASGAALPPGDEDDEDDDVSDLEDEIEEMEEVS